MIIGEVNHKKIFHDSSVQVGCEIKQTGCQHEIELNDKEIQVGYETTEMGIMTDPVQFKEPSSEMEPDETKNTNFNENKPIVLRMKSANLNPEPPKLAAPKKKMIFKAENSIDLTIFSNMPRRDSLILQTKYRKETEEPESFKLDQTIISESEDEMEISFSTYSFENKTSRFRNSKLFRKLNDLELKNLYIHTVFHSHSSDKDKQYVSSKRMNKIALHVFHNILIKNDMNDSMTIIYEYFAEKTKRDAHAIAMLKAVYNYCQVRESGNRTKIDILIKLIPFKMINMINTFKEILRGLYYSLDD